MKTTCQLSLVCLLWLLSVVTAAQTQAPVFEWAQKPAGLNGVLNQGTGYAVASDASGNTYVTGKFWNDIVFGNTTLTNGGDFDIFLAKYNNAGVLQWAQKAGGTSRDEGFGVAVDGAGNVFVTGIFSGSSTFGGINLVSTGNFDIFIAKYNASGVVQWVQKAGGNGFDYSFGVAADGSGNAFITGGFSGNATFGSVSVTSAANNDVFLAKYNAAGTVQWVKKGGGTGNDMGYGIAADAAGNAYVTGIFNATAAFDTVSFTSAGSDDIFYAKYNAAGILQWVNKAGGLGNDKGSAIAVDGSGNVYATGRFHRTSSWGNTTLNGGGWDIFIAKYNAAGLLKWVERAGGLNDDRANAIVLDRAGNPHITGEFGDSAVIGGRKIKSAGGWDIFVAKYDTSGVGRWVQRAGGPGNNFSNGIGIDSLGNTYITGDTNGYTTFGGTAFMATGIEVYLAKLEATLRPLSLKASAWSGAPVAAVYPNPFSEMLMLDLITNKSWGTVEIKLATVEGRAILEKEIKTTTPGQRVEIPEVANLAPGMYLLQVRVEDKLNVFKISKL